MDIGGRDQSRESATAGQETTSGHVPRALPILLTTRGLLETDDDAIDEDAEADEETVELQRNITIERIIRRNSTSSLLQKMIPFHWAPMLTPLTESDIDACERLEQLAYADSERRSTRELVEYRIRKCGHICFGLFNTYRPDDDAKDWSIGTLPYSRPVETGRRDHARHVMFAHILATQGEDEFVTDDNMRCPGDWRTSTHCGCYPLGHRYSGKTICLHSVAVCPEVQGIGIGKGMLKCYLQLMNESQIADRVALVCRPSLVDFFKRCGFRDAGKRGEPSASLEGEWRNMVCELPGPVVQIKDTTKPELSTAID